MNIPAILIDMLIFSILFTVMCFKTTGKNNTAQIYNYPPEIQEEYFKTHERIPTELLSKRAVLTKGLAILAFAVILVIMAIPKQWVRIYAVCSLRCSCAAVMMYRKSILQRHTAISGMLQWRISITAVQKRCMPLRRVMLTATGGQAQNA